MKGISMSLSVAELIAALPEEPAQPSPEAISESAGPASEMSLAPIPMMLNMKCPTLAIKSTLLHPRSIF